MAVEVVSPSNSQTEMHTKIQDYFRTGARLVWIVYPKSRTVYVYRTEREIRILHEGDDLEGGEVLAGFSVKVDDIFCFG